MEIQSRFEFKELERVAYILKAVAHPIRLQIVDILSQGEKLSVTEIYESLETEQSLTSHHLTKMKDRGILGQMKEGKHVYYFLTDKNITGIIDCIEKCSV